MSQHASKVLLSVTVHQDGVRKNEPGGAWTLVIGLAYARRCEGAPFVFVAVDGSSLTLTDRTQMKDFGAIGTYGHGARGLKVVAALAVDCDGVPVGLSSMQWCARQKKRRFPSAKRKLEDKELGHWYRACTEPIESSAKREKRV